ncbi:Ribonuclease H-like domain [Phytophthora cactorum]|nr:Ribonuclease H-like domain [Phytophthora cactorum]
MLLTHVGDGFYNCTTCGKQYKKDNGYTILLNHLRRNHEDYKQDAQEAARRLNSLNLHLNGRHQVAEECLIVRVALKKRKVMKRSHYVNVAYIPPTSNECERFFSHAKVVLSNLRKRMSLAMPEMTMCLHYNRDFGA